MFNFNHLNSPSECRYVYTFLKAQALKELITHIRLSPVCGKYIFIRHLSIYKTILFFNVSTKIPVIFKMLASVLICLDCLLL